MRLEMAVIAVQRPTRSFRGGSISDVKKSAANFLHAPSAEHGREILHYPPRARPVWSG